MALTNFIPKEGSAVFSFYNAVSTEVLENKGVRDSVDIVIDSGALITNLQQIIDREHRIVSVKDIVEDNACDGDVAFMACDGYYIPEITDFARVNKIPLAFSIPAGLVGKNKPSWTNQEPIPVIW